jgi:hypothetical protein
LKTVTIHTNIGGQRVDVPGQGEIPSDRNDGGFFMPDLPEDLTSLLNATRATIVETKPDGTTKVTTIIFHPDLPTEPGSSSGTPATGSGGQKNPNVFKFTPDPLTEPSTGN